MPDPRILDEVRDDRAQEVGLGEEVGVEDGDELALGDLQAVVERARLVARAVDAVDVDDVEPALAQRLDLLAHERARLVGRIVEHLDLEAAARPLDRGGVLEEAVGDRGLVVERELQA